MFTPHSFFARHAAYYHRRQYGQQHGQTFHFAAERLDFKFWFLSPKLITENSSKIYAYLSENAFIFKANFYGPLFELSFRTLVSEFFIVNVTFRQHLRFKCRSLLHQLFTSAIFGESAERLKISINWSLANIFTDNFGSLFFSFTH